VKLIEANMHEQALKEELQDTFMGFSEFNAIMSRMTREGSWKWAPPRSTKMGAQVGCREPSPARSGSPAAQATHLLTSTKKATGRE